MYLPLYAVLQHKGFCFLFYEMLVHMSPFPALPSRPNNWNRVYGMVMILHKTQVDNERQKRNRMETRNEEEKKREEEGRRKRKGAWSSKAYKVATLSWLAVFPFSSSSWTAKTSSSSSSLPRHFTVHGTRSVHCYATNIAVQTRRRWTLAYTWWLSSNI